MSTTAVEMPGYVTGTFTIGACAAVMELLCRRANRVVAAGCLVVRLSAGHAASWVGVLRAGSWASGRR
jgi:hypothetical protein